MLEIDKLQKRFPGHSVREIVDAYNRDFMNADSKDAAPPNSPFKPEVPEDLFAAKDDKKEKKSS